MALRASVSGRCRAVRQAAVSLVAITLLTSAATDSEARRYVDYVVDANSQTILNQTNPHAPVHPASLTKIMTLYLVFDAVSRGQAKLTDNLVVSATAAQRPASKLGLKADSTITLSDAILSLVTKSANDVATVIAEHFGGTESQFAVLMTQKARAVGMSRTTYRNASGLHDPNQVTTAYDQVQLARALYANFPQFTHYFSVPKFQYGKRIFRNHNNLLGKIPGVEGIKTGYINASGFNLITSTRRDGRHIFAVVIGGKSSRSRDSQMRRLLDRGFARLARYESVMARMARPRSKPIGVLAFRNASPVAASAGVAKPGVAEKQSTADGISRAATAVGEVLTDYVAIPGAQAAPVSAPTSAWAVQVGAFSQHEAAELALAAAVRTAPDLLSSTVSSITVVTDSRGTFYRARHLGLSKSEARQACEQLLSRRFACMVAGPSS